MKRILFSAVVLTLSTAWLRAEAPHMLTISAKVAQPGEVLEVTGNGLDSKTVEEVYLTDHKFDMKVKVLEQETKRLKFRVPPFAKAGRVQLMILTGGQEPKLLEQPLYLVIEEKNTEISAAKQ